MQRDDGAPDAAQLDWHVAGFSSIGLLARLVQFGPRRRVLACGELPCAPTAVDGDGDLWNAPPATSSAVHVRTSAGKTLMFVSSPLAVASVMSRATPSVRDNATAIGTSKSR